MMDGGADGDALSVSRDLSSLVSPLEGDHPRDGGVMKILRLAISAGMFFFSKKQTRTLAK